MDLLDYIKNRNASKQQSVAEKPQEQKPETAKEMYTREAAQEKANQNPIDRMPLDQQAKVEAVKGTLERATQHIEKSANAPTSVPADNADNREAMRQNMTGQDKAAPALSPTSAQAGQPVTEKAPSKEPPTKTQDQGRAQSLPRPRPSWER
jgi:hypothetical protein